jgi:hypothetical protein
MNFERELVYIGRMKERKKLVIVNRTVDAVQGYPYKESLRGPPEAFVVGDNGNCG